MFFYSVLKLILYQIVSAPSSHPILSPTSLLSPLPIGPFRWGKAFRGNQQSMTYHVEAGPRFSPCIKAEQGIRPWGIGSKNQFHAFGTSPGPSSRGATKVQAIQLSPRCRGLRPIPCHFLVCTSRVCEFTQVQASYPYGFSHHYLDPIPPCS